MFPRFRRWFRQIINPPLVVLTRAPATTTILVSLHSRTGSMTVRSWLDTGEQANALALLYAQDMSHVLEIELKDYRGPPPKHQPPEESESMRRARRLDKRRAG